MTRKSPAEARSRRHNSANTPHRQRSAPKIWWATFFAIAAVGAFYVGAHLRTWLHRHRRPLIIDAASVTALPSGSAATLLVRTPDDRVLLVTSDFAEADAEQAIQALEKLKVHSVSSVIITNVTPNTAGGIVALNDQFPITGPIVTPFPQNNVSGWLSRSRHNFNAAIKEHNLATLSWSDSAQALLSSIPLTTVVFYSMKQPRWDPPNIAVRVTYGGSSLLDIASLSITQVAEMTDQPIGGECSVIVANGQSESMTKEILSILQPNLVLLTGVDGQSITAANTWSESGDVSNIQAADAVPLALNGSSPIAIQLPSSPNIPVSVLNGNISKEQ